jgi:hypothetical protein
MDVTTTQPGGVAMRGYTGYFGDEPRHPAANINARRVPLKVRPVSITDPDPSSTDPAGLASASR